MVHLYLFQLEIVLYYFVKQFTFIIFMFKLKTLFLIPIQVNILSRVGQPRHYFCKVKKIVKLCTINEQIKICKYIKYLNNRMKNVKDYIIVLINHMCAMNSYIEYSYTRCYRK